MSFLSTVGGILGSALMGGSIPSLINTGLNWKVAQQNYKQQKRNYDLQRLSMLHTVNQQREAWDREDSATQRRAADLQAAGINPILAAGSAAGSMAPVQVHPPPHAPQLDFQSALGESSVLLNMLHTFGELEHKNAQNILLSAQTDTERSRRRLVDAEAGIKEFEGSSDYLEFRKNEIRARIQNILADTDNKDISWETANKKLAGLLTDEAFAQIDRDRLSHDKDRLSFEKERWNEQWKVEKERMYAQINEILANTDLRTLDWEVIARDFSIASTTGVRYDIKSGPVTYATQLRTFVDELINRLRHGKHGRMDFTREIPER